MTRFDKDDRIAGGETQADRDCRADLGKLGADFAVHPPLLDAVECSVVNPVTLKSLGKTIKLDAGGRPQLRHGACDGPLHAGRRSARRQGSRLVRISSA